MSQDPIAMYLIVRSSLGMGMGKTAAQVAHASQLLTLRYHYFHLAQPSASNNYEKLKEQINIFDQWVNSDYRKVVLAANDKEFEKIKSEILESDRVVVIDNGLTELDPHTETVIGLWPMYKSQVPKVIKRLQLLK